MAEETVSSDAVFEKIADAIAEIGPDRDEVKRDATLESLDVDSLDLVEVGQVIEEEYGVEIKGEDVEKLNTVGDVVDLVVQRAS
ncbi:MAG: acyl carrier protein [Chloroflexota bacterium]|nr:acyl carrier protein [Chloroflexota bacterium]